MPLTLEHQQWSMYQPLKAPYYCGVINHAEEWKWVKGRLISIPAGEIISRHKGHVICAILSENTAYVNVLEGISLLYWLFCSLNFPGMTSVRWLTVLCALKRAFDFTLRYQECLDNSANPLHFSMGGPYKKVCLDLFYFCSQNFFQEI